MFKNDIIINVVRDGSNKSKNIEKTNLKKVVDNEE